MLAHVRDATRDLHSLLDAGLAVAAPDAGRDAYLAHLRLLWQWLAPMQAWLDLHRDGPQDPRLLAPSARLQWLHDDLAELDGGPPALPVAQPWSGCASAPFRWGACYVVEGSQLGGRVLLQSLASRVGEHRPRLLGGGGAIAVGERWQLFLRAFRSDVTGAPAIAESCAGARAAFGQLLQLAGLSNARPEWAGVAA